MPREQLALKFPKGTKLRIHAVALPGESMTATILRALDGPEAAPQAPDVASDDFERTPDIIGLPPRVDALESRIAALEVSSPDLDPVAHWWRTEVQKRALIHNKQQQSGQSNALFFLPSLVVSC